MMTVQIDISKMKVKDIKDMLVKDHGYEASDLNNTKKMDLIELLQSESNIENLDISFGDGDDTGDFETNDTSSSPAAPETLTTTEEAESLLPPSIFEPSWSDYVLSKFEHDEMIDGNPTVDGLRRVTELVMGGITASTTEVVQVPTKENKGRATAIHTISVIMPDGISKTVSGSGDAWYKNADMPYSKFPVAMAETRAEGRALRRLLQLRKVVAAEELSQNLDGESDYGDEFVNDNQISFIDVMCGKGNRGLDISVYKLVNSGSKTYKSIREVSYHTATKIIQQLSTYQQNSESIPETLKGYEDNWRDSFDVNNS